jgi:hypothetical protein
LRLTSYPILKNKHIIAVQRLLGYEHNLDSALQILHSFQYRGADHGP